MTRISSADLEETQTPAMAQELAVADWPEELAVYGTAQRPQAAETANHLSQAIKNWYLVALALNLRSVPKIQ